jgi:hypothetical protein
VIMRVAPGNKLMLTNLAVIFSTGDRRFPRPQKPGMWSIGSNPLLDQDTPVDAIREKRFQETAAAATAMMDETFSG